MLLHGLHEASLKLRVINTLIHCNQVVRRNYRQFNDAPLGLTRMKGEGESGGNNPVKKCPRWPRPLVGSILV